MIKGNIKEKLNKETILKKVDDYNIFRFYLGQDFNFKDKYSSPFRDKGKDNKPNLCFFPGDDGSIQFKDFANGKGGDCFKFVQEMFKINFYEALVRIDKDLGLNIKSQPVSNFKLTLIPKPDSVRQTKLIQIVTRDFTKEELNYWDSYHINEKELLENNVFSIEKLYINKQLIPNYNKELRFAYLFDNYLKIYSPFSLDYKWISNCPNDHISGFDKIKHKVFTGQQDEKLIISKSVKDQLILSKFFKDVCSTQNESSGAINQKDMEIILRGYNPQNVYILYDNDQAGLEAAKYFVDNYGFKSVVVPNWTINKLNKTIKDWADLANYVGLDILEKYLKIKKLII